MDRAVVWWRPVWLRARVGLRGRAVATVALAVLIGLSAGVILAAVAGARRTETAVDRFMRFHRASQVAVQANDRGLVDAVAGLPQVADAGARVFVAMAMTPDGADTSVAAFAAQDDHEYRTMDRLYVVRGRPPELGQPSEVMVNEPMARRRGLRVGSTFTMYAYSLEQTRAAAARGSSAGEVPRGPSFLLRVVAVVRHPADLRSGGQDEAVVLTPAFMQDYAGRLGMSAEEAYSLWGGSLSFLRLKPGVAVEAFVDEARAMVGADGVVFEGGFDAEIGAHGARRGTHVQAVALWVFAGLSAFTLLLIVGHVIARQVATGAEHDATLRALGMTTGQLVATAACRASVAAGAGAAIAVGVAVAASSFFPFGLARRAEISPGVDFDAPVLLLGAAATLALVLVRASLAAWRSRAGRRRILDRSSPFVAGLARAGLPVPAVAGAALSVDLDRARTAVAFRGAALSAATAVAGMLAAATFGVSLNHLLGDTQRQGWNWDVLVGNPNATGDPTELPGRLAAAPVVRAVAGFTAIDAIQIDGHRVAALAMEDVKGRVTPTVLEGRVPAAAQEIALGSGTLDAVGRKVGDMVRVSVPDAELEMRVTGRIIIPTFGDFWGSSLSSGAVVTIGGAEQLFDASGIAPRRLFAVRFAPGADRQGALEQLRDALGGEDVQTRVVPQDIANLRQVAWEPYALAVLLGLVGLAAMGHALVTSIRRGRRDLAILKTLGFVGRQVGVAVAWQATVLATAATLVGVPLGLAAGRLAWRVVASGSGTFSPSQVSLLAVVAALPLALATANVVAAVPGLSAARVRPAVVLRAE